MGRRLDVCSLSARRLSSVVGDIFNQDDAKLRNYAVRRPKPTISSTRDIETLVSATIKFCSTYVSLTLDGLALFPLSQLHHQEEGTAASSSSRYSRWSRWVRIFGPAALVGRIPNNGLRRSRQLCRIRVRPCHPRHAARSPLDHLQRRACALPLKRAAEHVRGRRVFAVRLWVHDHRSSRATRGRDRVRWRSPCARIESK